MPARLLIALGCTVALAVSAAPASGAPRALHAPSDATMPSRPFAEPLRDDVAPARRAPSGPRASAAATESFLSSDGQGPIKVDLSPRYGTITQERVQPFVDFLASRLHGPELADLTVFIVTPGEVRAMCSSDALACYIPRYELMIIPGEQTPAREVPLEYVITHEYGHHVAANRDNDPWPAVSYGPKGWATHEGVCEGVAAGRYFPEDQEKNYLRNPGENWAEAYAQLQYRGKFPWQYARSLSPNQAAFDVVRADVLEPWQGSVANRLTGRLSAARASQRFLVRTALDGRVKLTLRGPRRANFDLQIVKGGRVRVATDRAGSRDTVQATDCQVRSFFVRVVRRSGAGRFMVRIQTPG